MDVLYWLQERTRPLGPLVPQAVALLSRLLVVCKLLISEQKKLNLNVTP